MLHVRFDPETSARLALEWTEPEVATADYSRAASLLFSVIGADDGDNGNWWPKPPVAKPAPRKRRKPRAKSPGPH
jgi:hypothetical protein